MNMSLIPGIPDPNQHFATPELQEILDKGVASLKQYIRTDVAEAHKKSFFGSMSDPQYNVVAHYFSKFLPHLPPTGYYFQSVAVFHRPDHWQNGSYNFILTQMSGSCLLPDDFHQFMLELTHAFGNHRIISGNLAYWLEHEEIPLAAQRVPDVHMKDQLLASIASVEQRLGWKVDFSTVLMLNEFTSCEWIGIIHLSDSEHGYEHTIHKVVHVKDEILLEIGQFHAECLGEWLEEMAGHGYIRPWRK